jgi:hypothetical protein
MFFHGYGVNMYLRTWITGTVIFPEYTVLIEIWMGNLAFHPKEQDKLRVSDNKMPKKIHSVSGFVRLSCNSSITIKVYKV